MAQGVRRCGAALAGRFSHVVLPAGTPLQACLPAGPLARPLLCRQCVGPLARSFSVPAPCCLVAHTQLLLLHCRASAR
jgi:hypothetical protein